MPAKRKAAMRATNNRGSGVGVSTAGVVVLLLDEKQQ
jgi:hypothetical protein